MTPLEILYPTRPMRTTYSGLPRRARPHGRRAFTYHRRADRWQYARILAR